MIGIGSICILADRVKASESFALSLMPEEDAGDAEAYFAPPRVVYQAELGLYSLKFDMKAPELTLKEMFPAGLGRWAEAWGRGIVQHFEGIIVGLTYILPPDRYVMTLDTMTNQTFMRTDLDGDGNIDRTTTLQNLASQARYPISELVLAGGDLDSLVVADQSVQSYLNIRALPRPAIVLGGGSGEERIEVFCRGFWWPLGKRVYNQTAQTGSQSMSAEFKAVLDARGEYVARQRRDANTTPVVRETDIDRKPLDYLTDMVKLGDSLNNRWIWQMRGRTCTEVHGRVAHLRQAAPTVVST